VALEVMRLPGRHVAPLHDFQARSTLGDQDEAAGAADAFGVILLGRAIAMRTINPFVALLPGQVLRFRLKLQ
jgi:hypothetical protein